MIESRGASATTRRRKARRGRPSIHDDKWSKVSVVLFDRQIERLDDLLRRMHRTKGVALTRAALIRAVIDGVLDSSVELNTISSERELRQRIATRLGR